MSTFSDCQAVVVILCDTDIMISMPSCRATESSVHLVLSILSGHYIVNTLLLIASGNLQTVCYLLITIHTTVIYSMATIDKEFNLVTLLHPMYRGSLLVFSLQR